MLIVNASAPKGPEIAMQRFLKPVAGVLIGNGEVPRSNGMTRETDGIVMTPTRVFVVEAKGFMKDTPNSGLLDPALNGDWTVGGEVARFYGNEWPNVQARQSAQTLAGVLKEQTTVKAFVTGIASISAKNAHMPGGPMQLGEVMVCKDHDLLDAVAAMPMLGRNKPVTVDHVFEVLQALRIPERMWPTRAKVEEQWAEARANASAGGRPTPAGRAPESDVRTFDEIMAEHRARRSAPREALSNVVSLRGSAPSPAASAGPNMQRLSAVTSGQPWPEDQKADIEQDSTGTPASAAPSKRMRLFWAVVAVAIAAGLVNKFVLTPDTGDMEEVFEQALEQAYPEAMGSLVKSSLACVEEKGPHSTLFYCGVLTRDSDEQRWRYEAFAGEPKFLTPDDVTREIADLGPSTAKAEGAESEALSLIRTAYPAKAKQVTREYVECRQGEDKGAWPFKDATFDCFGFDGPAGAKRYRYEVGVSGDDPSDFDYTSVSRHRDAG